MAQIMSHHPNTSRLLNRQQKLAELKQMQQLEKLRRQQEEDEEPTEDEDAGDLGKLQSEHIMLQQKIQQQRLLKEQEKMQLVQQHQQKLQQKLEKQQQQQEKQQQEIKRQQQLQEQQHLQQQIATQQRQLDQRVEQQHQRLGGYLHANLELIKRCRQKFEKLEETCMDRYVSREERVIATLNYCMTALEQLRSWAVFAIFPLDEQHSDKYINFVEQRYMCVVGPLRIFLQALQREQNHQPIIAQNHQTPPNHRGVPSARDLTGSPRNTSPQRSPRDSMSGSSNSANSSFGFESQSLPNFAAHIPTQGSLKGRINQISHQYLQESVSIKDLVVARLLKCRKEMRIIYRWGQASLMDLHDVFDESLADELYYMVRGKMARVLSAISIFEEAADQIESSMSSHLQKNKIGNDVIDSASDTSTGSSLLRSASAMDFGLGGLEMNGLIPHPPTTPHEPSGGTTGYDLRVDLRPLTHENGAEEDYLMASQNGALMASNGSGSSLNLALSNGSRRSFLRERSRSVDDLDFFDGDRDYRSDEGSTRSGSGSTPEPPGSPRPRYLGNHPKIMKDKLQTLALPSKFPVSPRMSAAW